MQRKRKPGRAARVIEFIEKLVVPSGKGAGRPFKMRPFQKKFIRAVYEPHRFEEGEWKRIVRKAILSTARKNGKTALIASLVLAHLVGPEAIPNGELYSAANDREQAAIIYRFVRQMVELDPELAALLLIVPSTKIMISKADGSVYKAISAEAGTKHGFNPTFVVYDELAQSKSRDLYDVLDTSFGAREEPLFVIISTQSNDPKHILSELIDDGMGANDPTIVAHLYEVPLDCKDIFSPKVWALANPALGDFRGLADFEALAKKAQRSPADEPKFRNLFLNQRYSSTSPLIARAEWFGCEGPAEFEDGESVYLSLDMSAVVDLSALCMISDADPTRVRPFFWKPEEMLDEHSNRDFGHNSRRYQIWHNEGWLDVSPGRSIDPSVIVTQIAELCERYKVLGLAYDRWRIADILREFDRIGFEAFEDKDKDEHEGSGLRLVPWGQGFRDMAPAIDALEFSVIERKLAHPMNPVLNWNVANAVASTDPAGNRKLDKEKVKFRIDGAVALAMAVGLKARDRKVVDTGLDDYLAALEATA